MSKNNQALKIVAVLMIAALTASCTQGGAPTRKRMPDQDKFALVPLPDASTDSLAISMLNAYKPFAIPLLSQWARQQGTGVMIDLRSGNGPDMRRADYMLERNAAFSIPVAFVWDGYSAGRAAAFMKALESLQGIQVNKISGEAPGINGRNRQYSNCFASDEPGF